MASRRIAYGRAGYSQPDDCCLHHTFYYSRPALPGHSPTLYESHNRALAWSIILTIETNRLQLMSPLAMKKPTFRFTSPSSISSTIKFDRNDTDTRNPSCGEETHATSQRRQIIELDSVRPSLKTGLDDWGGPTTTTVCNISLR
jgi:hypothetical protein